MTGYQVGKGHMYKSESAFRVSWAHLSGKDPSYRLTLKVMQEMTPESLMEFLQVLELGDTKRRTINTKRSIQNPNRLTPNPKHPLFITSIQSSSSKWMHLSYYTRQV